MKPRPNGPVTTIVRCNRGSGSALPKQADKRAHVPGARLASGRIFVGESLRVLVIGEQFAVAAEVDDRAQGALGVFLGHEILKLLAEPGRRRAMARAFVEH